MQPYRIYVEVAGRDMRPLLYWVGAIMTNGNIQDKQKTISRHKQMHKDSQREVPQVAL